MLAPPYSQPLGLVHLLGAGGLHANAVLFASGALVLAHLIRSTLSLWGTAPEGVGRTAEEEIAALRRALRESEARYDAVVEDYTEFIVRWKPDGRHIFVNPAFCRFFGISREEAVRTNLFDRVAPEHRQAVRDSVKKLSVENPTLTERHRTRRQNGEEVWTEWTDRGFFDARGELVEIQSIGHDITDLRRAELEAEQRRKELIEAEKMIALGNLVAGVAHEINNPNQYILLNLPFLEEIWRDVQPILERHAAEHPDFRLARIPYERVGTEIPDLIRDVLRGAERIKTIVSELRDYARQEDAEAVTGIDLNELVRSACTLLSNPLKGLGDRFRFEPAEDLPPFRGNPIRIEQAVINLFLNALHAVRNGGGIRVRTRARTDANWLEIEVADEGPGIPAEHMPRIRDPFFTTWRDAGRTGLGLAVASRIVQDHSGRLEFSSTVGRGTTARLLLPIADEPHRP